MCTVFVHSLRLTKANTGLYLTRIVWFRYEIVIIVEIVIVQVFAMCLLI